MKIAVKTITVAAIAALMLTGCAEKKEQALGVGESLAAETASTAVSSAVESKVGENASATSVESKTEESTAASSDTTSSSVSSAPVSSSTTSATSTTTSSSTTSKPASTTTTSSAASSKPFSTSTTSSTTTTTSSSSSTKPVEEPTPAPAHDCNRNGHIRGDSYTKVETESTEVVEYHTVAGNGYDYELAQRYFGRMSSDVDWGSVFGPGHGYGSATAAVKTTATKTTTKYFHTCKECGKSEMYDSTEVVDSGTKWERVSPNFNGHFDTIWYDINNVPQSVKDWVAKQDADKDDFLQGLLGSGNY